MSRYFLAVDIGASSGRHILGHMEEGNLKITEIYRFANGMTNKDGRLLWDVEYLLGEIKNGMRECVRLGKIPESMSIDTWAVDYVLLDEKDRVLGDVYGYRDERTAGCDDEVYRLIPENELYARTGIQKQMFNTIYQLMADRLQRPEILRMAKTFLMLPDYFSFCLTSKKVSEYTNATSTQLVSPGTKQWDKELLQILGYPTDIFLPLKMSGTEVGFLSKEVSKEVGFDCKVVLCSSHDTASAVMALPKENGDGLYISSGTWSLMGVELKKADCGKESRKANMTNEGGYDYRFRYLKNIMGLWMIQSVRHELKDEYSFAQLCGMAKENQDFPSRVDANDGCFMAPDSMRKEIQDYCRRTGQRVPETTGEMAAVIYRSLADCYGVTVRELERLTEKRYDSIHIIGGGANAEYLNQLTADATGKKVYAGPTEATAIGNLMAQLIKAGEFMGLSAARKCVYESFEIKEYQPQQKSETVVL